jgi:hypothetical protein
MMIFTHILVGVAIAGAVAPVFTGDSTSLVIAGVLGGAFPDSDMLLVHRKTLHFPIGYSVAAVGLALLALAVPASVVVPLAVAMSAAALHCLMDALGGGKEMRPWRETDDRAVYNHVAGQWIRPRRIFYDGSLPDLLLATLLAVLSGWLLRGNRWPLLMGLVAISALYTLVRRLVTRWISEEYPTFSSYIQAQLRAILR